MLNVAVRKVPNPFVSFTADLDKPTPGMPQLAVATGLALKGLGKAAQLAPPDEEIQAQ